MGLGGRKLAVAGQEEEEEAAAEEEGGVEQQGRGAGLGGLGRSDEISCRLVGFAEKLFRKRWGGI